jgi:O-antigen/teichoic acid export membrane protein
MSFLQCRLGPKPDRKSSLHVIGQSPGGRERSPSSVAGKERRLSTFRRYLARAAGNSAVNAAVYAAGTIFSQLLNVLLLPVLTRQLSKDELGIFAYTSALCLFLNLLGTLSLNTYVIRCYFDCRTNADRASLFGTAFWFLGAFNGLLLAGEMVLVPSLLRVTHGQVAFVPYMFLALLTVPLEVVHQIPLAYFRVREKALAFVLVTTLQAGIAVGTTLYFVLAMHRGVVGRYYGQLAADIGALLFDVVFMVRAGAFTFRIERLRKALRFSLPLVPYNLSYYVPMLTDRLILERYVLLKDIGIYSVGSAIASGMNALVGGVYKAVEPTIYREADSPMLPAVVARLKRRMLYGFGCAGLLLSALCREIVVLVAGPGFRASTEIVGLVTMAVVIRGTTLPMDLYLVALRKTNLLMFGYIAGAAASVVLNITLIRFYGLTGAGIAAVASALSVLLVLGLFCRRSGLQWTFPEDVFVVSAMYCIGRAIGGLSAGGTWTTPTLKVLLILFASAAAAILWRRGEGKAHCRQLSGREQRSGDVNASTVGLS